MVMIPKPTPAYRSRGFLDFAVHTMRDCCVCGDRALEAHHYGPKGMGQKGSDLILAPLCRKCHTRLQGKRALAFERSGDLETYVALLEANRDLLAGYVAQLETKDSGRMVSTFLD
jgi:hypothetical protein